MAGPFPWGAPRPSILSVSPGGCEGPFPRGDAVSRAPGRDRDPFGRGGSRGESRERGPGGVWGVMCWWPRRRVRYPAAPPCGRPDGEGGWSGAGAHHLASPLPPTVPATRPRGSAEG